MHLIGLLCASPSTHHNGAWRHPESDAHQVLEAGRYENLARLYERGLFDGVFFVDLPIIPGLADGDSSPLRFGSMVPMLDPMQILTAMSRVTSHIGLSATMSTTFNPPFNIARSFATLDHFSRGRAGWNVVTSIRDDEARLYGFEQIPDKNARYDRADQVLEACQQLWDTWSEDALVVDREAGMFADPAKIRFSRYDGGMVRFEGGLSVPRSPQGHPVIMQAGASARGMEFAQRWAEVIFSPHSTESTMRTYYLDVKTGMLDRFGRKPEACTVLPSIDVVAGESDAEAAEYAEGLDAFANLSIGVRRVESVARADLTGVPLDTPLSQISPEEGRLSSDGGMQRLMAWNSTGREVTIRDVALLQATSNMTPRFVGSAETVVDQMQALLDAGCCDGFIISHALSPGSLERFVDLVVPELQRRGLFRTEYRGSTFRENLHDAE